MATQGRRRKRLPDPTALAFLNTAQQYHLAATKVFTPYRHAPLPVYFLYAHTIELALKAFIRLHSNRVPHTHELGHLSRKCERIGLRLSIDFVNIITLLDDENTDNGFRYYLFRSAFSPQIGYLKEVVDALMSTLTKAIKTRAKPTDRRRVVMKITVGKPEKK
jgi:HEPN domain-containing protein